MALVSGARWCRALVALGVVCASARAEGQVVLDRYRDSLPGEPFAQIAAPKYQGGWPLVIRLGLSTRWIHFSDVQFDDARRALTDTLAIESTLSIAPHESVLFYAGVPVMALERAGVGTQGVAPDPRTPFVSDPRIGARLRAWSYPNRSVSAHLGGEVQLDSSWWTGPTHANDRTMRGTIELLLGGCGWACVPARLAGTALLWGANVGLHVRPAPRVVRDGIVGAHEFRLGGAIGVRHRGYTDALGIVEVRAGFEAMVSQRIFLVDAPPHVELSFPLGLVLSQDIDVCVAPSILSPIDATGVRDQWHFALTTRLSYALHDRVLDRATERRRAMPLSDANDEQDTDRDGRPDRSDLCPNDPHDACASDDPVRRPHRDAPSDAAALRIQDNFVIVDGVTTLDRPLAFSMRVDPSRPEDARSDPGYLFSDPVIARALRDRLNALQSDGELVLALWMRVDHGARDRGLPLRPWALAALDRALRSEGLDDSIALDAAPGFALSEPVRTPEDRFSLVLVARRVRRARTSPLQPSQWMPRSMMCQENSEEGDRPPRPPHPQESVGSTMQQAPALEPFRAEFTGSSAL